MYIVKDDLPENCLHCPHSPKCEVWLQVFDAQNELKLLDIPTPKPMQYAGCKIISMEHYYQPIANRPKWFRKWVLGECRHLCALCNYRKECDI